jgi:hypothetical protein
MSGASWSVLQEPSDFLQHVRHVWTYVPIYHIFLLVVNMPVGVMVLDVQLAYLYYEIVIFSSCQLCQK